jgi:hypothetical protein
MGIGNFADNFVRGYVNPAANIDKFVKNTSASLVNTARNAIFSATGLGDPTQRSSPDLPSVVEGGTLAKLAGRSDPILSVDWLAFVVDPEGSNASTIDPYYIDAVQTASLRIQPRTVYRSGIEKNYAGPLSVDNLTISLYTDRTGKAVKFASSWFNATYNSRNGDFRLPKEYKKNVQVVFFDPAKIALYTFTFIGCFPSSLPSYTLDGNGSNPIVTQLDLSVDDIAIDVADADFFGQNQRTVFNPAAPNSLDPNSIAGRIKSIASTYVTSQAETIRQQSVAKVMGSLRKFF